MKGSNQYQQQDSSEDLFTGHSSLSAVQIAMHRQSLKKARNLLFYVGGAVLVMTLAVVRISYKEFNTGFAIMVSIGVLSAAGFVALALWIKRKPYTAVVASMITSFMYLILIVALVIWLFGIDGLRLAGTILLLPIALIIMLSRHLRKARELQRATTQQLKV